MLVNLLLQDGRANYMEGVMRESEKPEDLKPLLKPANPKPGVETPRGNYVMT